MLSHLLSLEHGFGWIVSYIDVESRWKMKLVGAIVRTMTLSDPNPNLNQSLNLDRDLASIGATSAVETQVFLFSHLQADLKLCIIAAILDTGCVSCPNSLD